ncbi:MAG: S-methyl-5-thioribose-1-phosphate isomerase [Anaerolineae bacterium]|nr:S-methyl-5-thioribose-1-phosphate isomerase [Anaerolineae bacterium]
MRTVEWINGRVRMIDQRQLPWNFTHLDFEDYREVAQAITDMVVRGAPAIGATGAFGMALAAYQCPTQVLGDALDYLEVAAIILKKSRPTAVNLAWGVDRMMQVAREDVYRNTKDMLSAMIKEAQTIADQDVVINQLMGKHGAALIRDGDVVIHHCNTGALATVDYGTALGVIRTAWEQKKKFRVLLTETRPRMQGARLSAWELHQLGVPFEIIPDSSAGYYMRKGEAKLVLVGADRVAANGDTINKIGTYMLSVLAKENNIPFYTVAPTSTIDLDMPTGDQVPIEERSADEVRTPYGNALIPEEYPVRNPAFDVTPQRYLAGIVTEHGIALPPFKESLARMVAANSTAKVG